MIRRREKLTAKFIGFDTLSKYFPIYNQQQNNNNKKKLELDEEEAIKINQRRLRFLAEKEEKLN